MPSRLYVTFIDVGQGDSILIESESANGDFSYGLVDCNDKANSKPTLDFIKKRILGQRNYRMGNGNLFDFVVLTHDHADHCSGLKNIISRYGTDNFWYSSGQSTAFNSLLGYARRSQKVTEYQQIDTSYMLPNLGDTNIDILWPPQDLDIRGDINNSSIVLQLTHDRSHIVLTGDCLASNWKNIDLPKSYVKVFKIPHHGAANGMFDRGDTPWLDKLGARVKIPISVAKNYGHPDEQVLNELNYRGFRNYVKTFDSYHITYEIEDNRIRTQWSRY